MTLKTDFTPPKLHRLQGQEPGGNLAGSKAPKIGWMRGDVFTLAKLLAWQFAVEKAGGEGRLIRDSDWAPLGITKESMAAAVLRLLPDLKGHPRLLGKSDFAGLLQSRVYNMYRPQEPDPLRTGVRVRKSGAISTEHPYHPETKIKVEWTVSAEFLYRSNKPLRSADLSGFGFKESI